MAFTPTNQLKSDPNTFLRTQQHASRLFVDDQFRLAPKTKYLFHVAFGINQSTLHNIDLVQRHRNEINMLVKSCDLPKFKITTETVNQYNRKKVVQTQHALDPISIVFHDDNMGVIHKLWKNYYSYYYADADSASTGKAYARNATKSSDYIKGRYGLDNGSMAPFFNYITIYQMARHEYVSYKLINPIITTWNASSALAYSSNDPNDFTMGIAYESVAFDSGVVSPDAVEGFANEHYDVTPSPLTSPVPPPMAGPFTTASNSMSDVATITTQINTYLNTQALPNHGTTGLLSNIYKPTVQTVSGLQGISFPTDTATINPTVATQLKIGK